MKKHILFLTLISGAMMAPLWILLAFRWPVIDDPIFYATILKAFSEQFWHGEWYPRWLVHVNDGLGSPVFLFYGPVAFYITSIFQFLSAWDPHGFGRLLLGMQLALIVSGVTSYRWLKMHMNDVAAKKGALLYASFPYLLAIIYFYFGLAQLWAVAWFPLLLEAADDVMAKGWRGLSKLAIAYALLCMTHIPSLIVFGAVPLFYIAVADGRLRRMAVSAGSVVLGACLAGIYLLPMLLNRRYISPHHYLEGKLYYANNFTYLPTLFCVAVILAPLLKLYVDLPPPRHPFRVRIHFWLVAILVLLFMATPLSIALWDWVTPLQYLQFPMRFFIGMLPGVVFIAAHWMPRSMFSIYSWLTVVATIAIAIASAFGAFKSDLPDNIGAALKENLIIQPEYWGKSYEIGTVADRWQMPQQYLDAKTDISEGSGSVSVLAQNPRHIWLKADIHSPTATITLERLYFPGWLVNVEGAHILDNHGLLAVNLPKGMHNITLAVPEFDGEAEGKTLSVASILVLICLWRLADRRNEVEKSQPIG